MDTITRAVRSMDVRVAVTVALGHLLLVTPHLVAATYSVLWASVALLAVALLATWSKTPTTSVPVPTAFVALLALMGVSTLWSSLSWFTLEGSIMFVCIALAAWLIVWRIGRLLLSPLKALTRLSHLRLARR